MRPMRSILFTTIVLSAMSVSGQNTKIVIPAGSPEDKDLAVISAETDASKRATLFEEFLKKYADNKNAAAYAEWQLSQQYLAAGDNAKALEYGDKALELVPNNLDILISEENVARAMKDNGRAVDFAVRGAGVYHSIAQQPKPADVSDTEWATRTSDEQNSAKPAYEFLETEGFNAIASEQDANKRMSYIEKYTPAFPKSKFEEQISQLALYSLQQLNQLQRLTAYGEKALAANPNSIPTLLMMANAYVEDPKQVAKSITYAAKVIELAGKDVAAGDKTAKLSAGVAHSTIGYAYLKQEKLVAAIPELKTAITMLQEDPQAQQAALFRLGWAYAKQNHKADAVSALEKAAAINGGYQAPAREMLAKISAAGKK